MAFQPMPASICNQYFGVVRTYTEYYFGCRGKESSSKFFFSWSESPHNPFMLIIYSLKEQARAEKPDLLPDY